MQMRAKHDVDVLGLDAGFAQPIQPRPGAAVKVRAGAFLVVATTGVDQNGEAVLANQETLDGDGQDSGLRVLEARHQPVAVRIEVLLRAVGKYFERRQQAFFGFDDALQRRGAERPVALTGDAYRAAPRLSAAGYRRACRARCAADRSCPSSRRSICRDRPAILPGDAVGDGAGDFARDPLARASGAAPRGRLVPKIAAEHAAELPSHPPPGRRLALRRAGRARPPWCAVWPTRFCNCS